MDMRKTKTKTTYGVYNLIEWHALLRMGKATVKVHFTGGSITTQGVTPATFTTENPVIQFAIENSPEFAGGKIKIVRSVKLKEAVEIESNMADASMPSAATDGGEQATASDEQGACLQVPGEAAGESNPEATPAVTQVEFSCNDDAKDYLEQTFGCVRSKLHNREDIVNAGKSCNVEIIFV